VRFAEGKYIYARQCILSANSLATKQTSAYLPARSTGDTTRLVPFEAIGTEGELSGKKDIGNRGGLLSTNGMQ